MNTQNFNTENLITDDSFITWSLDTSQDNTDFLPFVEKSKDNKRQIQEAKGIVIALYQAKTTPSKEQNSRMLNGINSAIDTYKKDKPIKTIQLSWWLKAVAMITIVIGTYFIFSLNVNSKYNTGYNEMATIDLPDGSSVILNSNSTLKFEDDWTESAEREVWLEGEAYFEVNKSISELGKKFIVHADDLDIIVLGTQFNVNTHEERTSVVLEEGKVDIEITDQKLVKTNRIFSMTPGHKASFDKNETNYNIAVVNTLVYTSWKDGSIVFDGTTLSDLAIIIKNNYGYKVDFESEALLSKELAGKIENPNLETLLSSLETIFNLKIEKINNRIIIKE